MPAAPLVAFLVNPNNPLSESDAKDLRAAAHSVGQQILLLNAGAESDIGRAFTSLVQQHAGALIVQADPLFNSQPERLATLAAKHAVPTIYQFREFTVAGGLMSYGSSLADAYLQVGALAGKILNGAKPADLPVQQALKVEQLRLEWRGQDGHNETEQPGHSASLGDSIMSSTRTRFSVHTTAAPSCNASRLLPVPPSP
jgi:putative tryptophan/tyrosine transport system substrate-binding protein